MTDLEICRLSAEALGKPWLNAHWPNCADGSHWDPLTNAEQRWECVEWLIAGGYQLALGYYPTANSRNTENWLHSRSSGGVFYLICPASEFPARAVAELQKRKEK